MSSPTRPFLTPPRRPLFSSPDTVNRRSGSKKQSTTTGRNWTALLPLLSAVVLGFSLGILASTSMRLSRIIPVVRSSSSDRYDTMVGPGWGDPTGANASEIFFHIEPFESGLNNERISLLKAAEVASRKGYTLVLPSYKDFHGIRAGDASAGVVLPFSHFYDEGAFAQHAASKGFRVVREMPPSRFHACAKQLALASTWPTAITSWLLDAWADEHGVACLLPHAVWFRIRGTDVDDLDWSSNKVHAAGLRPSEAYRAEVEGMLRVAREKFGGGDGEDEEEGSSSLPSFIAVHVRIEDDWRNVCEFAQNRTERHWLTGDNKVCLVPEATIAERVLKSLSNSVGDDGSDISDQKSKRIKKKPLAFVMSADPTSSMPALCGDKEGALRCFTPDEVWLNPDETKLPFRRTKLVRAYVSFLFAKEASALYGNVHSTFTRELGEEMASEGKRVEFYNPECLSKEACP